VREKQKPPRKKIIWGAAVRSGRQAPLFVLAAGGGRPAEEGGAGELSCPSVVAS